MAGTRRTKGIPPPARLILDSGAVIALARNDDRARAVVRSAWEGKVPISIPAVVLAETVRGVATDARANRVVAQVGEVIAVDEAIGRAAGALLGTASSSSTIDALIVACTISVGGGVVLTSDPDDLRALADGHPEVVVQAL